MNSYITLLRNNPNYRNLWLGAVISQIGDWFNLIAAASLISDLTGGATALSGFFLARFLPLFFFSPLAGVLADRFNRRHILVASDLLRAVTVLGFLLVREPSQIWILYVLTVAQFALSSIFTPARSAIIANIVDEDDLVTANALDSFTWSTMLAVGSLLGGIVAGVFGLATAFAVDALTFLLAAWFASRIIIPPALAGERAEVSRGGLLDFVDGLRYLRGVPFVLILALVKGGGSLVWGAINVLEVNFAEEIFALNGNGSTTLGIIYAISGLGTGLGPLLLRRWLGDEPRRMLAAISAGMWILSVGILGLSLAPTLPWFGVATLVRTIGSGTVWVFSAALLQTIIPDRFRGRVFAFEFAFLTLTQSISIFWAGLGQDTFGLSIREVTASMGLAGLVVAGAWLLFHLRIMRLPALPVPPRKRRAG